MSSETYTMAAPVGASSSNTHHPGMRRSPSPSAREPPADDIEAGPGSRGDEDAHHLAQAAAQIPRRGSPYTSPSKGGLEQGGGQGIQLNVSSAKRYGQAVGMRAVRAVRKGQLPLMLLFFCCVLVFFGALTGFGYVDPDASGLYPLAADAPAGEFQIGQPVFDRAHADETSRLEEMRRLEEEWARKKRPKDGAWMKKQRDQRAVRRVPLPNSPGSRG